MVPFRLQTAFSSIPEALGNVWASPPGLSLRCRWFDEAQPGLDIRHRLALGLAEMNLGAKEERAEHEIGQRQDHVEIFVHVAVMEQVMAVEPEENAGSLHVAPPRQMHAPVHIFISGVIDGAEQG